MTVFLSSEPKHQGSLGKPGKDRREIRILSFEKNLMKVEAADSPDPNSSGHSTSLSIKVSDSSLLVMAARPWFCGLVAEPKS
mmetsp:Transcript_84019/g.166888  ORF Transcript_84019/g.166888 Transcript_84019/m.166888 type:complete len:82 (+) Transcript_84019:632-877(+)